MIWLFDSHSEFLAPDLYSMMVDLTKSDKETLATELIRNTQHQKKTTVVNTHINILKCHKSCIENIPPSYRVHQTCKTASFALKVLERSPGKLSNNIYRRSLGVIG